MPRRLSAGRLSSEAHRQQRILKSGETASKRGASCTSTIVSRVLRTSSNSRRSPSINLGSAEKVSINQLVDIVEDIAGIQLKRRYNLNAPKGVDGRNSDNALINKMLGWEPSIPLRTGMERTYAWIYDQIRAGSREMQL